MPSSLLWAPSGERYRMRLGRGHSTISFLIDLPATTPPRPIYFSIPIDTLHCFVPCFMDCFHPFPAADSRRRTYKTSREGRGACLLQECKRKDNTTAHTYAPEEIPVRAAGAAEVA